MLVDGHLWGTPSTFHSQSLVPDILVLTGVSLASWLTRQLLGCTSRTASLVAAQAWDQRKSPETETSMAYWTRDLTCPKQRVLEQHPTVSSRWQTEHGSTPHYLGEEKATIYRGNSRQVGSSVTRETSSWGRGQAHRQLLIKPYDSEDWIVMWVKQGLVEQGMHREQENSHLEWPDHTTSFTKQ